MHRVRRDHRYRRSNVDEILQDQAWQRNLPKDHVQFFFAQILTLSLLAILLLLLCFFILNDVRSFVVTSPFCDLLRVSTFAFFMLLHSVRKYKTIKNLSNNRIQFEKINDDVQLKVSFFFLNLYCKL